MKTVKEIAEITGVSIRTLRYYDEIGLLIPTSLTEAGYRLYDNKALEKLQEILFYRELDIPLNDIKAIVEHTLANMSAETKESQIKEFGSEENYRAQLAQGFQNEQAVNDLLRWYGSKEKVMEAFLESDGDTDSQQAQQDRNAMIYAKLVKAKKDNDDSVAEEAVKELTQLYKEMFKLDNARNIIIDLAKEYLTSDAMRKITDEQYGEGFSDYIGAAINRYYGV